MKTPADFRSELERRSLPALERRSVSTVQVNVGKLCNQACHHCHVDAGPKRTEQMTESTADLIIRLIAASASVRTLDITGGAPELNSNFERLVVAARTSGLHVIDRCNLTVLFEPGMDGLADFFVRNSVHLVCSLPCYTAETVDRQRGSGVFEKSIEALRMLTAHGYGERDSGLQLDLVYNPTDDSLPPPQHELEAEYKRRLAGDFGIHFNDMLAITNMPIRRFAEDLARKGRLDAYMALLVNHFNPATVADLMCRDLLSVGWDGGLYDCDFNQMLELPILADKRARTLAGLESFDDVGDSAIATGSHCFGCTAGAGSGCSGAIEN
jgi:radical SAM/Cys-rich protein